MAPFNTYNGQTSRLLHDAYNAAWSDLEATSHPWATHAATKARLTRGLLAAAATGERDPAKLKLAAIHGV
jgi:hypothetical protein